MSLQGMHPVMSRQEARAELWPAACKDCVNCVRVGYGVNTHCTRCMSPAEWTDRVADASALGYRCVTKRHGQPKVNKARKDGSR